MPDRQEVERRKQINKELREKDAILFENSLPVSREEFQNLFDFLDTEIGENGCDDTLKITKEFLVTNHINNIPEIESWLRENGGFCDCEVLYNVEELFEN